MFKVFSISIGLFLFSISSTYASSYLAKSTSDVNIEQSAFASGQKKGKKKKNGRYKKKKRGLFKRIFKKNDCDCPKH